MPPKKNGGNVTSVHHERGGDTESVNGCYLRIAMETRDYIHVQEIAQALKKEGFSLFDWKRNRRQTPRRREKSGFFE